MRVFYVSSGNWGCYIVRCLLPLVANGWDGDSTSLHPGTMTPEDKAKAAKHAEVVVFHRPDSAVKIELARNLKKLGKKIVFDNDDTYRDAIDVDKLNAHIDKERTRLGLARAATAMDGFVAEADLVTCTTEMLAKEYRKLNHNIVVLPNCVDPDYFEEPLRNESDIVRIGVTGSITSSVDLEVAAPIIKHFEKDPRVKIVFFGLQANRKENPKLAKIHAEEYAFLDSVDVEYHGAVNADVYYDKINELKLDMMIMPRADNYFNRCKSNLKFLEASMFEIPCVGQAFPDGLSPYQVNPEDSKHMLLATDTASWIEQIEKLIADKELRRSMGKKAHEYVLENYNIESKAHLWDEAYASIL